MPDKTTLQLVSDAPESAPKRDIVTRWGGDPDILSKGYVAVPVNVLSLAATSKPFCLTPTEVLFVVQVMSFKWDEKAPFPGYKTIAARMGISETYARKLARSLEDKGFMRRVARVGRSNAFDFTPLFQKVIEQVKPRAA